MWCSEREGGDRGRIQKGFLGEGSGRVRSRIVEEFSLLCASRDTSSCVFFALIPFILCAAVSHSEPELTGSLF